jgi:hypothetical protein
MESTSFLITPSGAFKLQATPVKDVAEVLRKAANDSAIRLNGAFEVRGNRVGMAVSQSKITVGIPLKSLTLTTYYTLSADGKMLFPRWSNQKDSIQASCVWNAPDTMHLILSINCLRSEGTFEGRDILLFACHTKRAEGGNKAGFFKLPLPNTHGDARLCMGNDYRASGSTIQQLAENVVQHLEVAPWNTDLQPNGVHTNNLFRFDPATFVSLPPEGEWQNSCTRVSRTEMEALINGN